MRNRIDIPEGLYGITGDNFANGKSNYQCVEEMIKGGIKIVQYRDKRKNSREKVEEAGAIRELCRKNNVLFIVNDDVAIAMLVDADGVHVGQEDMKPADVRKLLGENKIIGLSTHSEEQGMAAYNDIDVDYIGVGPIFPTTTKDTAPVGLGYLEFAVKNLHLPFIAIGGIKDYNIDEIIKRGAKRICLVSDIVGAEDICKKIIDLNNKILKK
ncbi:MULTISPECIES: thiamine phosphate synthase [Fusobacterium]|uniref:Thiamine-phosphate synthase n=1 Tax=Fusobacterium ulcerans TaxID=861 RepID=A0AAX2J971_9FUSO|nr:MULTISPECIES: thiamine phosphate synthase [Fusobacterium]AVQ29019.1 thiamine phosphate synthase [Fusobacterium ulcerans]EFS26485.2 thiamine-phosphate pyrophosphorylase [Fusobacterium ulcerans ATCC 49185]MDH6457835.1 thiamine-phosphate pyrophosphorylase [Fusobacterium sp. PH5-7]SQJ01825.1 Thiamine-phosphate synthase [Fusobacterium ulcerans]